MESRLFKCLILDEDMVDNIDEAHLIVKFNNGKTLGCVGSEDIKQYYVVSGGMVITVPVIIIGGRHSCIESPFIIFQNKQRNYPIKIVPHNVLGVSYRTQPRG